MGRVVGVGVVGLGRIGVVHAEIFASKVEGSKLVAVCSRSESKAKSVASQFGANWYTNYEDMLKDKDVEAVAICTPTFLHADMIIKALEAGKHVFVEKPLTVTVADAERVVKAASKASVICQVGYMRRFEYSYSEAKKAIDEGKIGRPVFISAISRDPAPPPGWVADPKLSGGIFLDLMSHDFDAVRWLMGSEVTEVYAYGEAYIYDEVRAKGDIDVATVFLKFANGGVGIVHGTRKSVYGYDIRTEVYGTDGTLFIGSSLDPMFALGSPQGITYRGHPWFQKRFYDAYVAEDKHFIECILEGKKPLVGVIDGLRAVQIAEAAWKSIKEGKPVKIEL